MAARATDPPPAAATPARLKASQIRALVEKLLAAGGYEVESTSDPLTAHALVRASRPDLVLCDIAMPGLDGYGVLKALQADPATASVPVVFLTAHQEFSERVRAFRYGVVDYLAKPFTASVLLKRVEQGRVPGHAGLSILDDGVPAHPAPLARPPCPTGAASRRTGG